MSIDKLPITARGYAALEEELKRRQQVERPRIIQAISEARALGDLSENAEYHAAKEAQSHNEGRVLELESMIARAEIIDDPDGLAVGNAIVEKKYGWQFRLAFRAEQRHGGGASSRVILKITPA